MPAPGLVLAAGLAIAFGLWTLVEYDRTRTEAQRTAVRAARIAAEVDRSLHVVEQSLRMAAAGILWRSGLDESNWVAFADRLQLPGLSLGGVSGLGFAPEVPPDRRTFDRGGGLTDASLHARHPLRFRRQWDAAAPLPPAGTDVTEDSRRIPDLWRVRRSLGPVYSTAWSPPDNGDGSHATVWLMLAVDGDVGAGPTTRGVLVASLDLAAILRGALVGAEAVAAQLEVPDEGGRSVRVATDGWRATAPGAASVLASNRSGQGWSLKVAATDAVPMFRGSATLLGVGCAASVALFLLARRTREVRRSADRFEARARRGESRFQELAESAPFLVWMTDLQLDARYLNPVWGQLTGAVQADGAGSAWRDFIHPDDRPAVAAAFSAGSGTGTFRCRLRHRDGSHRWLHVSHRPLSDDDGVPTGFMGVGIDIDSVQRAEEEREADRQMVRDILDSVPAPICAKTEDLRYTMVNDAMCRLLGRSREAILGHDDFDLYPREEAEEIRTRDRHALTSGAFAFEAPYRFPGGTVIDAMGVKAAVRRADGSVLVLTNLSDVTALRAKERELLAAGARLRLTGEIQRSTLDARPRDEVVAMALDGLAGLLGDVRVSYWAIDASDSARVERSVGASDLPALADVAADPHAIARYRERISDQPPVVARDTAEADAPTGLHQGVGPAVVGIPVRVAGALVGVVEVEAGTPRPWSSAEVGSVVDVGNVLAAHSEFAAARDARDAAYRDLDMQRAFLDAIIDSIPHPVFVKDRAHRLVTVNHALATAWQLSKAEIAGRRDEDFMPREIALQAYAEDDLVFEEGVPLSREMLFRQRDGRGEWSLLVKQPIRHGSGRDYLVGVAIPVGALKDALQRAEESERLLSAVLNAIPAPVVAKDEALRWVLVNDAHLQLVGRTREEVLGLRDAELLPGAEAERFAAQDRHVLDTGQPQLGEESFVRADGTETWRIKAKQLVRMADGRRLVVVASIDITDRKRMENAALEAGQRLQLINDLAAATIAGAGTAEIQTMAVDGLARLVRGCGAAYVDLDAHGHAARVATAGFPEELAADESAFEIAAAPALLEALAAGGTVVVGDAAQDIRIAPIAASRRTAGMLASIEVPVLRQGRLRGVAVLCAPAPRDWPDESIGILQGVADALALALESGEARAERVESERRLREAKDFVEALIDAVPQAIFVKDAVGAWVMANDAFLRMTGRTRAGLVGRTNRDVYPQTWEQHEQEDAEAFASAQPVQFETPLQDASGRTLWWLTSKSTVQLSAGARYLVCTAADVTALKSASLEVERGRQFLDAILNALPVPIFVKSEDHRWVVVNAAGAQLLGRPRSELIGRTDHDFHEHDVGDAVWLEDDHVLAGQGPIVTEVLMPLRDGKPRWIMKTKVATTLCDGSRYVISASVDITGRKRAEEEVFASRARLEVLNGIAGRMVRGAALDDTVVFAVRSLAEILGGANVSYWRRDADRFVLECESDGSQPGLAIDLGGSAEYLARLEAGETIVVSDSEQASALGEVSAVAGALGMSAFIDVPIRAGFAGGLRAVLTLSSPMPRTWSVHERRTAQEAAESLMLAHINDGAERARARVEAELRENEAVLQAMVWASDLGLWTWDAVSQRYHFSDRAASQLGYAAHELDDAWDWRERMLAEDGPRFFRALRTGLRSAENRLDTELRLRHRDGGYRNILVRAQIQRDERGAVVRFVGGNIDVTEFRRTQDALARHRDDLEREVAARTTELVMAKDAAEAANAAKSEFLANMSHELRTPMHSILSFSRLGIDRSADGAVQLPKVRQYLDRIHKSGERLLTLLNDLLDLAKLEAGKMRYDLGRCDLVEVAGAVAAEMAAYARERGVRIDLSAEGPVSAWCDGARVGQVVRNLLSNAVKFTPPGKPVRVVVDLAGPGVARIAVLDAGVGIPEHELEAVFDKFVQSSKTNSGAGGTGLGLAICREIAQHHGGRIWARNNPEGGACFTLMLPTDTAERADSADVDEAPVASARRAP